MKAYRFSIILLASIFIGGLIGFLLGEDATVLKPFGDLFLNLMFTIIIPLVFFSVSSSIASMQSVQRFGKIMGTMLGSYLFTGILAAVVMLGVVLLFPLGSANIALETPTELLEPVSLGDQIVQTLSVPDFTHLLSRSNMLALIVFSVLVGYSTSTLGDRARVFREFLSGGSEVMMKIVNVIMLYAPIGLGAYFATLIGEFGPTLLGDYVFSAALYYPTSIIYYFVFFTFFAFIAARREGVRIFWKNALEPTITPLATCSSAASIPVNLEATKRMGVPKDIREMTVPLGAVMHKDGSVLGGVLKIAFLFSVFNKPFEGVGVFAATIIVAILCGTVMGAIPSGGMIGEMLIITLFGFPPEALPIIAAISTIIDPPATMVNSMGNTVTPMLITRFVEGKDWLKNASFK
ncbi:MAG: dicarboxylate/amino acid:cation symporter [Bacilli bacterium]